LKRTIIWIVLAIAIAAGAPYVRPLLQRGWLLYELTTEDPPAHLPSPIKDARARQFVNSWGGPRSGGRRHQGIDIFAPRGTAVLSTTRGFVTTVGTNTLGGNVVWVLGPGLEWHYYAHLDRFAGFRAGDVVKTGDILGYVGNTGNARGTPSHLHYGIYGRGGAENPYPRLVSQTGRSKDAGRS
jgi:murein DD-endopeptidase MepM/ murein hydrolase activator NlpD